MTYECALREESSPIVRTKKIIKPIKTVIEVLFIVHICYYNIAKGLK